MVPQWAIRGVADELVEHAVVVEHHVDQALEVVVQQADDLVRTAGRLAHGGKAADVREEHGGLALAAALHDGLALAVHHLLHHVGREEARELTAGLGVVLDLSDEAGVGDRLRGLAGQGLEQLEVLLAEGPDTLARVEVHDAVDGVVGHQRHDHGPSGCPAR
jgi:hypothetical protein